jgi:cytochrome c553
MWRALGAARAFLLVFLLVPCANASPQRLQTDILSNQTGLPWAYGFSSPAPPEPTAGVPGGGTAAPAAVAAQTEAGEDTQSIRHVTGSTGAFTLKQVDNTFGPADWFPGDHPAMPEVVSLGRKPDVNACGFCHYPNGKGRPNNAGPAGLPVNYILQQLADFRSGARTSWDKRKRNTSQMINIAKGLTAEEARAAAEYFALMKWTPWIEVVETDTVPKTHFVGGGGGLCLPLEGDQAGTEPLGLRIVETPREVEQTEPLRNPRSGFIAYVPAGSIKKGEALVLRGGPGKTVACAACHGEGLQGHENFPSLAGRSPSYLARQLYDFQHFTRVGPGAQLMQPIVQNLSEEDILDITAYIASLRP